MCYYSTINKTHPFLKLFILVKRSTCFERSFRPSSGTQNCKYSNRRMSNSCCYLLLTGAKWFPFRPRQQQVYACCCMCSFELLQMMDGKPFRNLYSVLQV
jgi:hypothetical protein